MSATGRSDVRRPSDFYRTPSWCVHRLLDRLDLPEGNWLEPSAGDGAILSAVDEALYVTWTAVEIREEAIRELRRKSAAAVYVHGDFLTIAWDRRFRVCITNPPYSLAWEFVRKGLADADWVVMLLRLNWLGSQERSRFLRTQPPDVYVLPNRPTFCVVVRCVLGHEKSVLPEDADGLRRCGTDGCTAKAKKTSSDSTEYAWFVWPPHRERDHGQLMVLDSTGKEDRR